MLPLGMANEFALLSLTRICDNGKWRIKKRSLGIKTPFYFTMMFLPYSFSGNLTE